MRNLSDSESGEGNVMIPFAVLAIYRSVTSSRAFFLPFCLRLIRGVNSVLTMAICIPADRRNFEGNFTPIQSDKKSGLSRLSLPLDARWARKKACTLLR